MSNIIVMPDEFQIECEKLYRIATRDLQSKNAELKTMLDAIRAIVFDTDTAVKKVNAIQAVKILFNELYQ